MLGTEYWLDHDVNVLQFVTIPFEFISSSRHFAPMGPTDLLFVDGS